jgi:TAT (twin-arginine translocation) pathway signal sequence
MSRIHRRQLLKGAVAASAGALLHSCSTTRPPPTLRSHTPPRVVFLRFGGGVRFDDVFGPEASCLAPTVRKLASEGVLYSGLWNDHLTRHDCATRYLLGGRYGKRYPSNAHAEQNLVELDGVALVHEVYRRNLKLPEHKALAIGVPEHSSHPVYGAAVGAGCFSRHADRKNAPSFAGDPALRTPSEVQLANSVIGRLLVELESPGLPKAQDALRARLLQTARELPATLAVPTPELRESLATVVTDRAFSPRPYIDDRDVDTCLTDLALAAMRDARPDLVSVGFVTPDLAHRGAWREYAAAVRVLDRQVQRVAEFIARDAYYRDRTLLLIAPDTGRSVADFTEHDRPFDEPSHRQLFLAAWGGRLRSGVEISGRREQIQVAPTIAARLGFEMPHAEMSALEEVL